ncbi:MAG: DNA translocase FtsK [Pyrinomonadaceae bacterium]
MANNVQKPNQGQLQTNNSLANEIVGIILLAISVLLLLCLFTYNASDPSLNTASEQATQNFVGAIGANLATLLFQSIGLTAYVVPILLLWTAWQCFWSESLYVPVSRIVGFVLLVGCLSALLPLFGFITFFDASVPAGGLVGTLVSRLLATGLSKIGASILLLAIGAAAFLLVTGVSYAPLIVQLKVWYDTALEKIQDWRDLEREQSRIRFENRKQSRTEMLRDFTQQAARNEQKPALKDVLTAEPGLENAAVQSGFFAKTAQSVAAGLKGFIQRIRQPPDFITDEKVANNALQDETQSANGTRIEIKSPRVERGRGKNDLPANKPEKIADEKASEVIFDADIPIQPLKSGDAAEPDLVENEFEIESDDSTSEVRNPKYNIPRVFIPFAEYELPPTEFLNAAPARIQHADTELLDIAHTLTEKCREFRANGSVVNICPGPVVTTYEYKLDSGVKFSVISNLVDDLCLGLQAESVRIDRIPGKAFVGVEVPNPRRETIFLREVLEARAFRDSQSLLTIALGKTADGLNYVADLAKMPHLLIAGATGAGKSVGVNSLIVSILYKARPDEVKFIMVDPKQVELNLYADIPHLATPIITDPKRASAALKWAVAEMERRYKTLSGWFVRNIEGYNAEVHRRNFIEEFDENGETWKTLPYIVIIIDEFADLMITSRNEVEESIMRLVAKARAVGIHLILATQRPSVDVVTGVIKANFPCRIAFRVSSGIDSKTIINGTGAEHLLGRGDMLFLPPGASKLIRVHGAFVEESEISKIVTHVKQQGAPEYDTTITQTEEEAAGGEMEDSEMDELFEQALRICVEMKRASTSVLQRRLSIGYGRAAKIIDGMERAGYVGQADGASKPRPVLGKAYERIADWDEMSR